MKKTLAVSLLLTLAACGEPPAVAPNAHAAAPVAVKVSVQPETPDADRDLARRVMRAFDDAKLHGIEAVSAEGIVTLWGTTVNVKDRVRATDIAGRVEGVKAVENRLEVVSGS